MRFTRSSLVATMILAGCSTAPHPSTGDDITGVVDVGAASTTGGGSDPSGGACAVAGPPGTVEQQMSDTGGTVLVANAHGDVAYSFGDGITRVNSDLATVFTYPYGQVVAIDAQGNSYVAGSFTQPTDFGTGSIAPTGNIDVFLVKLSLRGQVLFARDLGLCGDGVQSIAVSHDGRIAVSGDAMGTAVLDDSGTLLYTLAPAGYVAFDSHDAVVIGGMLAGSLVLDGGHTLSTMGTDDVDAFVAKFDATGRYVFATQLGDAALPIIVGGDAVSTPRAQAIAGVAVGPNDEIAIVGLFHQEMSLFGQTLKLQADYPSGQLTGEFVAKLAADGSPKLSFPGVFANAGVRIGGLQVTAAGAGRTPGTAIVMDAAGNIIVSDNYAGDNNPPEYPQLTKYDGVSGDVLVSLGNDTSPAGRGFGVAVDGCGNIYWSDFETRPSILDAHDYFRKVAP